MTEVREIRMDEVPDAHCHDCKRHLTAHPEFATYNTKYGVFYKCGQCYARDDELRNYIPTEVYSRVVGYLRPVENWNTGKQAEWKDRVTYERIHQGHREQN